MESNGDPPTEIKARSPEAELQDSADLELNRSIRYKAPICSASPHIKPVVGLWSMTMGAMDINRAASVDHDRPSGEVPELVEREKQHPVN